MPKITAEFKTSILGLPLNELQTTILKYARKDQAFFDFINLQLLNNQAADEWDHQKTAS